MKRCAETVARAQGETGKACLYVPNLSMPTDRLRQRALEAKQAGAGGLLVAPAPVGFDATRMLADDDSIDLPIICHPALLGLGLGVQSGGISHRVWLGQLRRLAGADAVIFPSYGGRFAFTEPDCRDLVDGTACEMASIRAMMRFPAGGMSVDKVPEMLAFYGRDMMLLISGDLHRDGPDLAASCRRSRAVVEGG